MYVVVDIGGTKTRVAASGDLTSLGEPIIIDTPQSYEEGMSCVAEAARTVSGGAIERMAIGLPGGRNLPDWRGKPLAADVETRLGAPVVLENDAALVGLGEAVFGAGKGADIVAYLTVSTGVNGARIVHGRIDASHQGFEIGGQYLSIGEEPQTLESLISGRAISERFDVASPKDLGKEHEVWEELARTLAFGVHNTILHWSPERVVIGGSMMNEIGISVPRVETHVRSIMQKFATVPLIVHSGLKDLGGLWGALALISQQR